MLEREVWEKSELTVGKHCREGLESTKAVWDGQRQEPARGCGVKQWLLVSG